METRFLFTLTFLFFQTFGKSSNMITSNVTCIEREKQSLLVFKQSLKDSFDLLSTWRGVECCEWLGVGCDSGSGHVVKLDLRPQVSFSPIILNDRWLEGELSPWLQNLTHLRYLDLSMNMFLGKIPEFLGSFQRLEYLDLSGSTFSGVVPHRLGSLSRLKYLDLSYISLGFPYPLTVDDLRWVSTLSSLRHLDLSNVYIGKHIDWFHPVNMLPSLLTLNLAWSDINIPSNKFVNFTSLYSLDLSSNYINSTIPVWLSNLTGLTHLDLGYNYFHGKIPDFIGVMNSLASIDLSWNFFGPLMPDLFCNLSNLVYMDLSSNRLTGPIPVCIGSLLKLESLYLHDNRLSGSIPESFWQLSELKNLDLMNNSLVGVLSETHFTKLKNLNYLDLSWNLLALNLSSQWIPPFQLQVFYASFCHMIKPHFPNWLQTQTNLQKLDLKNSSIIDILPEWFESILSGIDYLDLSNNQIGGTLPRFHVDSSNQILGSNRILMMNSNKFEGSLVTFPLNVIFLDLSDNLLSGYVPQIDEIMNPSLEGINLSKNRFTGNIPVSLCKVPSILVLDLSQNKFFGRLPECLGSLTNMGMLDVSSNDITNVVPSSLGSLAQLKSLHLQNNRLEGGLPVSLRNLTNLVTMDLGNNLFTGIIPFWIGEKLSNLRFLNLQSNKFRGEIPLQLCQLNALQYLSLANNNITGTIPGCLKNWSGMINTKFKEDSNYIYQMDKYEENTLATIKGRELKYINKILFLTASLDLSSNNIFGEIPDALMNLVGLRNLNLSGNLLNGQIPMLIGDLKQLESLDLSMNKLSGRIPPSLTRLNSLSYLNLSFNRLSGPIPVGNQLQTLDDPSIYEGNSGLCGPPVSRSCNGNNVSNVGQNEGLDDTEGWWFYAGMGPGFVVGLVGLLGSLHFIRRWRLAYFKTLENVYGWVILSIQLNLARLRRKVFK